MPVDAQINLNIKNSSDILGNSDVNNASAPTKPVEPNPVTNNRGITEVSNAENDFITTFPGTPKPSLREPEIPAGQLIDQTLTLAPEVAKALNLSTQTPLGEFIIACTNKMTDTIGKIASDGKLKEAGVTQGKFDSEMMECLVMLLTMDSKSKLIQTLQNTLQAKINDRKAANQELIDKNTEVAEKNVEQVKKKEEAEAKRKAWGILGAIFSAIVAVFSVILTVVTCGAATPVGVAAICGCAMTVAGSACTIAGLATGNEKLQQIGMWLGLAGGVFSLASGIGSIFAVTNQASNLLKIMAAVAGAVSGVTSSTGQIVNGFAQKELAEIEKELNNIKISLDKLQQQINLLSDMIDKVANSIQNFMKDLFKDEEEVSQMVQQMMKTVLDIEQNVKC